MAILKLRVRLHFVSKFTIFIIIIKEIFMAIFEAIIMSILMVIFIIIIMLNFIMALLKLTITLESKLKAMTLILIVSQAMIVARYEFS